MAPKVNHQWAGSTARRPTWSFTATAWQYGQLVNFAITPDNVMDNNGKLLTKLLDGLKGQWFGDRGYLTAQAALQAVRRIIPAGTPHGDKGPPQDEESLNALARQAQPVQAGRVAGAD